jgi:hypothetical protein
VGEFSPLELELRVALAGGCVGETARIKSGGALNLRSTPESRRWPVGETSEVPNAPKPILESEVWRFGNTGGNPFSGEFGALDRLGKTRLGSSGGGPPSCLSQGDWVTVLEGRDRDGKAGGWLSVGQEGANGESSNGEVG